MSVFSNENFLPGVVTEIENDYSFGFDTSLFGTTDSLVIVGTAFNGPVGIPVPIYSPEHGKYVFGKTYDTKLRKESTLVANIKDAYDRGCRTIYAVRVGGKEINKDFDFSVDCGLRLRVSGLYPSNQAKDVYMLYDNTSGNEVIKLYKPAEKATIAEKMQGLVVSDTAVLVTEIRLNRDYGMTKDSNLIDFIDLFNNHQYNNVITLSIVDKEGADVTTSVESKSLTVGYLFPGVYFIGRNESSCPKFTDAKYSLVKDETSPKPYSDFEGLYFKRLVLNTDVSVGFPIYAENPDDLRKIIKPNGISMVKNFDFLESAGLSDRIFTKDKIDYEETALSAFDIYSKLGCGYAVTAKAEKRVDGTGTEIVPKVKEAPMSDAGRIQPITDGIYAMLENLKVRYRVVTCANADDVIANKLPRPEDFFTYLPEAVEVLNSSIRITPKIAKGEKTSAKSYKIRFDTISSANSDSYEDIYTDQIIKLIDSVKSSDLSVLNTVTMKAGSLFFIVDSLTGDAILNRADGNGGYEKLSDDGLVGEVFAIGRTLYEGVLVGGEVQFVKCVITPDPTVSGGGLFKAKQYVIVENNSEVFVFQVIVGAGNQIKPLGTLDDMMTENKDGSLVFAESNYFGNNEIIVSSAVYGSTTLEEFVEFLNAQDCLNRLFDFEVAYAATEKKDDYMEEVGVTCFDVVEYYLSKDRVGGYDYSLYIPYKTSDNFARQMAQHCTYTELKTVPTHGFIGCKRITDLSLGNLASHADKIIAIEFDLYAKNNQGRNMLDRDNLPYPVGRNLSIILEQHVVQMDDGYKFISNNAAGYAGMVSNLPLDQSSTNQPINIPTSMLNFTNFQLGKLTQRGIVTVKQSYTRGWVITDGVTCAPAASEFRRLAACRVAYAVEELIRKCAEPFIGKQNHDANRNSLRTAIKSDLEKLKGTLIEAYEFNMIVDPKIAKFNYIDIEYSIVPVYEIREVRNKISVKESL